MTRQPTPGVYKNYREPGEFGEGVTVRRREPADILETYIELNMSNYDQDDVERQNAWAIDAYGEIERMREALRKIAAYDDAAANAYLRATGNYRCFDEPGAVEMARGVLEGKTDG